MSEVSELTLTKTSLPDIALPDIGLEDVDINLVRQRVEARKSALSERKRAVLSKKILTGIAASSMFLSACGVVNVARDALVSPPETQAVEVIEIPPAPEEKGVRESPSDLVYEGDTHVYLGEAADIIARAKEHFGVEIISPTKWGEEGQDNLPWNVREIGLVAEAISQLPPAYLNNNERSPKQILLLKAPGSSSEGGGGGYNGRQLVLYISETFSPDAKLHGPAGDLYGFQRDHLRAAVVHEWTHSFLEAHPELEQEWVEKTGWIMDLNGDWVNQKPENLIHDGNADKFPGEDISVSAGLFLVNPDALPDERLNFFLGNEYFSNWPAVLVYKQEHGTNY